MGSSEAIYRRTENVIAKRKRTKGQTTIYKRQHRKLMIEQHEPHQRSKVDPGTPEEGAVSAPLVTPVLVLFSL